MATLMMPVSFVKGDVSRHHFFRNRNRETKRLPALSRNWGR